MKIGVDRALYRRHPALTSTILELPAAVDRAGEIAAREGLGDRVKFRAGNALTDDLGLGTFDVVMINNLAHHFTPEQETARRVARALVGGGHLRDLGLPSCVGAGRGRRHARSDGPLLRTHQRLGNLVGRGDQGLAARGGTCTAADPAPEHSRMGRIAGRAASIIEKAGELR